MRVCNADRIILFETLEEFRLSTPRDTVRFVTHPISPPRTWSPSDSRNPYRRS